MSASGHFLRSTLLALCLTLAACSKKTPQVPKTHDYPLRGTITAVDTAAGKLRIAHEDIPGFMEAMTMEFPAPPGTDLTTLAPGDGVEGTLRVTETDTNLATLRKTGRTELLKPAPAPSGPPPGTRLPEAALLDEAGAPFSTATLRGKTFALTFIYTRCPLPDYCPRMNAHFAATARLLPGEKFAWLSATIDPANDTPNVLAEWAKQFVPRDPRWKFLTGPAADAARLAKFAGVETRATATAPLDHTLRTLVITPNGTVARVFTGNDWQPAELAAAMRAATRD